MLLARVKAIERDLGRVSRCKWGPREIDIDILAMDDVTMDTPELTIPHRVLLERDFVLLPLADVAPDWRYPLRRAVSWHGMPLKLPPPKVLHLGAHLRDTGLKLDA